LSNNQTKSKCVSIVSIARLDNSVMVIASEVLVDEAISFQVSLEFVSLTPLVRKVKVIYRVCLLQRQQPWT